mmetsp:Transcript_16720/g.38437  ORF Transcript_16720/g.38437 Transcript_16720/m.38437 type:complete len:182 (+) Transcript_16720:776-1321(+)
MWVWFMAAGMVCSLSVVTAPPLTAPKRVKALVDTSGQAVPISSWSARKSLNALEGPACGWADRALRYTSTSVARCSTNSRVCVVLASSNALVACLSGLLLFKGDHKKSEERGIVIVHRVGHFFHAPWWEDGSGTFLSEPIFQGHHVTETASHEITSTLLQGGLDLIRPMRWHHVEKGRWLD